MQRDPITIDEAEQALGFIDPNITREEWVRVGMALKSEYGEEGFALFDTWSADGVSYDKANLKTTWRSIKAGGSVTIGTLIAMGTEGGWERQRKEMPAEERARLGAARDLRRKQLEEQAVAEAAEEAAWYERVSAVCMALADKYLAPSGRSGYLTAKKVPAFGLLFVPRGIVVVTYITEQRIEIISGKDQVSNFFNRRKSGEIDPETTTFLYLKYGTIAVPMRDADGKLWSMQFINEQGTKLFPKFGRKKGLYHLVADTGTIRAPEYHLIEPPPVLAQAEGYSTAASIHMATGWPVAVAFDAGNMLPVAAALRGVYPDADFLLCGDNDQHNKKNAGLEGARAAAEAVGGCPVVPEFKAGLAA